MPRSVLRACASCGLLLAGCTPAPRLDVAPTVASTDWSAPVPAVAASSETDLASVLGSPELAALIARARLHSPRLAAADARIDAARALLRTARGAALPTIAIGASATGSTGTNGGTFDLVKDFTTLDAAMSIDLAGGTAGGIRAANSRARAVAYDRDALDIALAAEIARTFVARAALHARIGLIDRSLTQAHELMRIIEWRRKEGVATDVDVSLQALRIGQLDAEREQLRKSEDDTRTGLAVLMGAEAPLFDAVPADIAGFGVAALRPPSPARLIATRPDVLAAEARIAAAGGDVAVARAAFFPRLDLSLQHSAQSGLTGGALSGVIAGAQVLAPIFARNRLRGDLDLAAARQREAVALYREALLTALADVENGLSALAHARHRQTTLNVMAEQAHRTVMLARSQYLEGEADLRHLLDAQDLEISAQDAAVLGRQEELEAAILLYRVSQAGPSGTPGHD
ncbi:MAG: TolC family protein [Sphingomonadales bacterium]|nr:TolC family protein [Sphingomonadales bacterium]